MFSPSRQHHRTQGPIAFSDPFTGKDVVIKSWDASDGDCNMSLCLESIPGIFARSGTETELMPDLRWALIESSSGYLPQGKI